MAKVLSYTDPKTGAVYPESVWLPMFESAYFAARGRQVRVVFDGYADVATLLAGLGPVGRYEVERSGAAMLEFVAAAPVGDTLFDVVSNACYALVAGDEFFAGAADVEVNLLGG